MLPTKRGVNSRKHWSACCLRADSSPYRRIRDDNRPFRRLTVEVSSQQAERYPVGSQGLSTEVEADNRCPSPCRLLLARYSQSHWSR